MFGGSSPGTPLLRPGRLGPRVSLSRASGGTYLDSSGALQSVVSGVPRFPGSARRLLIEGAGTNQIRNPRFEGAVPGSPGTAPTFMTTTAVINGLTYSIVETGITNGNPYIDIGINGTAAATIAASGGGGVILFEGMAQIAALTGQTWTGRFNASVVSGTFVGSLAFDLDERTSGGSNVKSNTFTFVPTALPTAVSLTVTLSGGATTAFLLPAIRQGNTIGDVVAAIVRFTAPQIERQNFPTSLILPPVGSPAASARALDAVAYAPPGGLPSRFTVSGRFMIPNATAPSENNLPRILSIDDGSINSTLELYLSTNNIIVDSTVLGVGGHGHTVGQWMPGVVTGFSATADMINSIWRASIAGGAPVDMAPVAIATPPTTAMRIGNRIDGARPAYFEIGPLSIIPGLVASNAQLKALST